ncbi:8482_t:CDS:2, partial [Gigaspora rosea]
TDLLQDDSSNDHVETNTELLLNKELNLPLQVNEPENIEEQDPEIELEVSESPTSKTKAKLAKIINDLTEEKHNTPLCADPLLTYAWKDQVNEIIQKPKRKQVRTLEACYYLGKLQEEFQDVPTISKEIREQIKHSLGSIQTNKVWK